VALHFFNARADGEAQGGLGLRPILSGPDATEGEREYGDRINWEHEVEAVLAKKRTP